MAPPTSLCNDDKHNDDHHQSFVAPERILSSNYSEKVEGEMKTKKLESQPAGEHPIINESSSPSLSHCSNKENTDAKDSMISESNVMYDDEDDRCDCDNVPSRPGAFAVANPPAASVEREKKDAVRTTRRTVLLEQEEYGSVKMKMMQQNLQSQKQQEPSRILLASDLEPESSEDIAATSTSAVVHQRQPRRSSTKDRKVAQTSGMSQKVPSPRYGEMKLQQTGPVCVDLSDDEDNNEYAKNYSPSSGLVVAAELADDVEEQMEERIRARLLQQVPKAAVVHNLDHYDWVRKKSASSLQSTSSSKPRNVKEKLFGDAGRDISDVDISATPKKYIRKRQRLLWTSLQRVEDSFRD